MSVDNRQAATNLIKCCFAWLRSCVSVVCMCVAVVRGKEIQAAEYTSDLSFLCTLRVQMKLRRTVAANPMRP